MLRDVIPPVFMLGLLVLALTAVAKSDMGQVRTNIERIINIGFNEGKVAVVDDVFADTYIRHPNEDDRGAFKQSIDNLRAAIPDLHAYGYLFVVKGNWAAFRLSIDGTFEHALKSPQGDVPPTNKPVHRDMNMFLRLDDKGKVAEEWDYFDNLGWLMQLGVIPSPSGEAASIIASPMMTAEMPMSSAMEDANKATIRRLFDEVLSTGRMDLADQFVSPDFVQHAPGGDLDNAAWKAMISGLHTAIPDLALPLDNVIAQGNLVAVRNSGQGTFSGGLMLPDGSTLPANNAAVVVNTGSIWRLDKTGKVEEAWETYDQLSFLQQIGAIPATGSGS